MRVGCAALRFLGRSRRTILALGAVLGVMLAIASCASCPACGGCGPAIEVTLVDPDTNRAIGEDNGVAGLTVVGAEGGCNSFGVCQIEPSVDRMALHTFDIVRNGDVLASISERAAEEQSGAACCNCGYATRQISVDVDL